MTFPHVARTRTTDRSPRWALFIASLVPIVAGCAPQRPTMPQLPPPQVTVAYPLQREVTDFEETTGRLAPVEAVEVRARVSGYLKEVTFKSIDDLANGREPGPPKEGELREGLDVTKGTLLFEIDPRPYLAAQDAARAEVERTKALLIRFAADARRAETLLASNNISKEEYDRIAAAQAEASANVQAAEAKLKSADLNVEYTKVRAEISGRLGRALVTVGNLVVADVTPLTTIVREDPIDVFFDLPEQVMLRYKQLIREHKLSSARDAEIPVWIELGDEHDFPHQGTIDFVDNRVDVGTATLRLRAEFDNPVVTGSLRRFAPGNFVRVRIPAGQGYQALLVTNRAITVDLGVRVVYVVDEDNVAHRREVQLGSEHDGLRVITKGLEPTDRVVVNGVQRVRDGVKVQPQMAEMPGAAKLAEPAKAEAPAAPP